MDNRSGAPAPHLLFVTSPLHGHINPVRRLAARVVTVAAAVAEPGVRVSVSVATAVSAHRRMFPGLASPDEEAVDGAGVLYVPFSDGFDEGFDPAAPQFDVRSYSARARAVGSETLSAVIARLADRGRPVTYVVYTFLLGWVPGVARAHGIPTALYWIQPASVLAIYYHYFHGHDAVLASCARAAAGPDRDDAIVRLPGLPPLRSNALPSMLSTTSPDQLSYLALNKLRDIFSALDEQKEAKVLVNTFDALESDALRSVPELELIAVGPAVPHPSTSAADLSQCKCDDSKPYMAWLDTKAARSVVYVSFGSILPATKRQEEETRRALESTGRPWLWVLPHSHMGTHEEDAEQGMVVEWCDQGRVLSHPAVGCFVTHCGWNSALESVACGVPIVAMPQWTDQPTVAWLVAERAGVGVRASAADGGEGVVGREELRRCVETVTGDGDAAAEIRTCTARWMERATEAVAEGGTSEKNLGAFVSFSCHGYKEDGSVYER